MIIRVFQQQGFAVEGVDGIGGDGTLVRLGDISIKSRQSQFLLHNSLISRRYRTIQRQFVLGCKHHVAAGDDRTCHCLFFNFSGTVLFLFPTHGQRAFAFCDEFSLSIDVSENQGAVLNAQRNASHTLYIGRFRRDVHRSTVI